VTPPLSPRRVTLVTHRDALDPRTVGWGLHQAFARRFDLATVVVEDGWPRTTSDLGDLDGTSAVVFFVRFAALRTQPPFSWGHYPGLRAMYDQDAYLNFRPGSPFEGAWPDVVARNCFDVLLCSGKQVTAQLSARGVRTYWLPKGYDTRTFRDLGDIRAGYCFFRSPYPARRAMLDYARRRGLDVRVLRSRAAALNVELNRFLGCVICNMEWEQRLPGRLGRRLGTTLPRFGVSVHAAFEPMIKNFEVAGAGCAPIADEIPELADLGFVDGDTMVGYRNFAELVEKLRDYGRRPDDLRAIGARAAALAQSRHTWDHRVAQRDADLDRLPSR